MLEYIREYTVIERACIVAPYDQWNKALQYCKAHGFKVLDSMITFEGDESRVTLTIERKMQRQRVESRQLELFEEG